MKSERSEVKNAAAAMAMVAMVASASFIGYNYEACGILSTRRARFTVRTHTAYLVVPACGTSGRIVWECTWLRRS